MLKLLIAILSLLIISECNYTPENHTNEKYEIKSPITKIEIRLKGKVPIEDDNLLKKIMSTDQINKLVLFANNQLVQEAKWRDALDGMPSPSSPFMSLIFYEGDKYKGQFGIGSTFFSTTNYEEYKLKLASKEERLELLHLADITESQYNDLYSKRLAPGPWSQ